MARQIPLTQGQFAIVDDEDFERLNQHNWYARWSKATNSFYAVRNGRENNKRVCILMHRVVINAGKGQRVDHRTSTLTLDNRHENLRIASALENNRNARLRRDNRLQLKGVRLSQGATTYEARIKVNGKLLSLGRAAIPHEAARIYDRAALAYFGEFAQLNFPREDYTNG